MILFGVQDDCVHVGLSTSLMTVLDPAKITDQLRRKAPSALIPTMYVEVTYYRKRFGALVVSPLVVPLVFDVEWGYNDDAGVHRLVIRPGLLYVRTPGRSAPAHQADLREMWQRSVDLGARQALARIERVAALPPDAELIVSTSASPDEGFVLGANGEGRPVRIVDDPDAPAVRVREVLSPDTPYASVAGELTSQVRHWQQADNSHRVSRHALLRWWLQRTKLNLDDTSAEFCVLSAAYQHGYPMYWASKMTPAGLRELLDRELRIGRAVPCQTYPYIVGEFFWEDRKDILEPHLGRLSVSPRNAAEKVIRIRSYDDFLAFARWTSRLHLGEDVVSVADLLDDLPRALTVFTALVQGDLDGSATQSALGFAKQLDLVIHAVRP